MIENECRYSPKKLPTGGNSFFDYEAPLFIAWQLNSACNLNCLHCCEEAGQVMPNELSGEEIKRFIKEIVALKVPYVAISGGEPFLHPDFFKICEFLRSHGISLKVETNGHFINGQIAKRMAKIGFRSVQVSVDGATPQAYGQLRINGDFEKTIKACESLINEGINTEIVFVPTKFNIHETGDLIEMAYQMGVYGFYTGKIMRIGRAAQNWRALCPTKEKYDQFFAVLKEKQAKFDGKMKVYFYPYDVIEELKYRLEYPSASLLVIPDGKVKLIGPLPFICADLRKHSLSEAWRRYQKAWKEPSVIDFTKRVIDSPTLLKKANQWRELSIV